MQMRLGKRADYSVRAILHLATYWNHGGRQKARAIAEAMAIPEKYLPQVLAALVRAGLVSSEPGPGGGYRLAVDPDHLTLLGVIEAVEGPIASVECVLRGGPCHWQDRCAIHESWSEAQEALRSRLGETSFADLAELDSKLPRPTEAPEPRRAGRRRRP